MKLQYLNLSSNKLVEIPDLIGELLMLKKVEFKKQSVKKFARMHCKFKLS